LSVEDTAVVAVAAARVRAALRDLPAEQSRAVLLAASYGHTAEEISQLENIPVGTAKTRIRLGLRKVRALLADGEAADGSRLPVREEL
jgi:RNA polymerase sigma-70 factor (ECF subfamily)